MTSVADRSYVRTDVTTLPVCTLERHEIPQYVAVLERLLAHAGVLEQLLCRISFFLPGHVVEYVVAIVRSSLPCVLLALDDATLARSSRLTTNYLF